MRWVHLIPLPVLLGSAASTGPAVSAPPKPQRACFWPSQVTGFTEAGPDRTLVNIGFRESWELTLSPGCSNVDWALKIGIRARAGERICPGRPAELLVPDASGSGFRTCLVRNIRKLSAAETAAARGSAKP